MKNRKFLISILLAFLCVCFAPSAALAETAEPAEVTETSETAESEQLFSQPLTVFNLKEYLHQRDNSASSDIHVHSPKFIAYDAPYINDSGEPKDGFLTAVCLDSGCGAVFSVCVPYEISYKEISYVDAGETTNGLVTWGFDQEHSRTLTEEESANFLSTFDVVTEILATGHDWDEGVITTAPTCAAMGIKTYTCAKCGATRVECVKRTNHYDNWVFKNWVEKPTCADPIGRAAYVCTQCNDEVLFVRSGTDADLSAAHVWNEGEVTIPATTEDDGEKTFTCTICGATKTETIHNWVPIERVDASCTEDGYIQYACVNCNAEGQKEILPAAGHSWETLEDGTKYCSVCMVDEYGKPLFVAADYAVSKTEKDCSSQEALGDFADVIDTEEDQPLYFADVKMISVEDGEEVSEFSEHGNCPSFDISLAELGIDSSTPMEEIHVYQQHEDGEPNEIPECDKIIEEGVLRVFTRDFSVFLVTANHTWETLEDGTKYCSVCNTDEEGKPLYIAADYAVSRTEKDCSSEEALGDFADVIDTEEDQPLYFADVKMISVEDGEEISEFSEHGNCPSFDISLAELGIDSSVPIENIHVYHQHEGKDPEEIRNCDKMIVGDALRIFSRDFSTFLVFTSDGRTATVSVFWQGTQEKDDSIAVTATYTKDGKKTTETISNVTESCEFKNLPAGDVTITVPTGFSVERTSETELKFKVTRDVYTVHYKRVWDDNEDKFGVRPTIPMAVFTSFDLSAEEKDKTYTEYCRETGDEYTWKIPQSMKNKNGEYTKIGYKLVPMVPTTEVKNYSASAVYYKGDSKALFQTGDLDEKLTEKLNTKTWNVQIKWLNRTRMVLTMPNKVEVTILYYNEKDEKYEEFPKNGDFTITSKETNASGNWETTIKDLPTGYKYRVIEKHLTVGGTSYITVFTDNSKLKGSCYRYSYRSVNSTDDSNRTVITNSYDPGATPVTADQSQMNLWLLFAAVSLGLAGGFILISLRNPTANRKGKETRR